MSSDSQEHKLNQSVDYSRLRRLLLMGLWEEADFETGELLLLSIGVSNWRKWETNCVPMSDRRTRQSLRPSQIRVLYESEIAQIPCVDLQMINQLWLTASNGRFGFSVQKEIYQSVGKDYQQLGDRVGWRVNRIWRVNTLLFEPLVGENYILTDNGREAVDLITGDRWRIADKIWIPWWEMTFSLDAPPGHLPAAFWSWWVRLVGKKSTMYPRYRDWIGTLLERVDACGL